MTETRRMKHWMKTSPEETFWLRGQIVTVEARKDDRALVTGHKIGQGKTQVWIHNDDIMPLTEYTCWVCDKVFTHYMVRAACDGCVEYMTRKLSQAQYVAWLKNAVQRIEAGLPLNYYDDTTIGAKELYCSWGLCSDEAAAWTDKNTWRLPDVTKPDSRGNVRHINEADDQHCPFDSRVGNQHSGCFRRCLVFQGRIKTKEEAIQYYRLQIHMEERK